MTNRAPLIVAIALLLLPLLYVGSYLALVEPSGPTHWDDGKGNRLPFEFFHYGDSEQFNWWAGRVFWPLEQVDRKLRPGAWEGDLPHYL